MADAGASSRSSASWPARAVDSLRRAQKATEAFYLGRFPVEPIALVRIVYGCVLACSYLFLLPDLERLFGPDGLSVELAPALQNTFVVQHVWLSAAIMIAAATGFALGLLTPVAGVVLIVGHLAFREVCRYHTWGWTAHVHMFVAYLVLARCGARYSLDAWLRRRLRPERPPVTTVPAAAVRLMQLNITSLYLMVAWHRIFKPHWLSGSMVYHALASTAFSRFPHADLEMLKPVLAIACWAAWLFELGAPVLIWVPKTRTIFTLGLMAMHLGLELTSTVGWWQFAMLALLWVFLPPPWARWILTRPRGGTRAEPLPPQAAGATGCLADKPSR